MDTLATKLTRRAVRDALTILPAEVNSIYNEAMIRISGQRDCDKTLAKKVLTWITYACRPLSLVELLHAVAISPTMSEMDSELIVPKQLLTSVCAGLVVVDENRSIVRLVRE